MEAVRKVISDNLDKGFREGMQYGMIGYFVPHETYPPGYHADRKQPLPYISLASQKQHMAIYMFCLNCDPVAMRRFTEAWAKTGKKLDMGKSCIRFKKIEDLPLELIGETVGAIGVQDFIASYEAALHPSQRLGGAAGDSAGSARKTLAQKSPTQKSPSPNATTKKSTTKKAVTKKASTKAGSTVKAAPKSGAGKKSAKTTKKPGGGRAP